MTVDHGQLVLSGDALVVVHNGLLAAVNALDDMIERTSMLLGRELAPLRELTSEVRDLYNALNAALVAKVARVLASDSVTMHLRRALYHIRLDEGICTQTNALRARLGASPAEMLPRTQQVASVAAELHHHVGDELRPRTIREWLNSESAPRLELVRKTCMQFLETGAWLKLSGEVKGWRRQGLTASVTKEAEAMWRYGRVSGDTLIANIEAFTLFPESDPYLDRTLALVRAGTKRFLEGATRDPSKRPPVTEAELRVIAGDTPLDKFMRFVERVSCLGSHGREPFSWTPDRDILRYYPAISYEDLVAVDNILPRRHGTGEQCLWLLRAIADTWTEQRTWPTLDGLLADARVGPEFYRAWKSLRFAWLTLDEHGLATVDLDGLILGASDPQPILQAVAIIIGTLADELEAGDKADVGTIAKLTGVDAEFVRRLLPLLARDDLGLSNHGSASNPEAYALSGLAEYIDVCTPEALAERWVRNRDHHPMFARANNKERLNVFGVKTLRDRLLALSARGDDVRDAEGDALEKASTATDPKPSTCARLLQQLEALRNPSVSPQKRGRQLEGIVYEILDSEKLDPERNLIRPGEEVDLSFTLADDHFLVECKWLNEPVGTQTVKLFMNKVREKAEGTFGVFLSMSGYVDDIDAKAITSQRLNAVGLGPSHLMLVLQEKSTWAQLVRDAVKGARRRARFTHAEEAIPGGKPKRSARSPVAGKRRR